MSNDLEDKLRSALRPVDPGEEFSRRVLTRIAAGDARADGEPLQAPPRGVATHPRFLRPRLQWWSAALAASLVLGAVGAHLWREQSERAAGLEARQQLIEALRVTSDKLDLAYQGVRSQTRRDDEENAGA